MTVAELIAKLISLDGFDDRTTEVIVGTEEVQLGPIKAVFYEDGCVSIVGEES